MFIGYFDDTGGSDTYGVGAFGLLASAETWFRFARDWAQILAMPEFDLPHLHMKELRGRKGRFAKFKDESLEARLFERLYALMRARSLHSVGCFIPNSVYEPVDSFFHLHETIGRFGLAGMISIVRSQQWMETHHPGEQTKFVFDAGYRDWDLLVQLAQLRYGITPLQADMRQETALQVSDHVAWESHRFLGDVARHQRGERWLQARPSFHELIYTLGGEDMWIATEDRLLGFCEKVGLRRR
jgi:hypothetical protein